MKQLTRKFAISILAMVFAVVALGSTTFAWFTMTGKAEVSSIQASIVGGDGLEVRLAPGTAEGADDNTPWTAGYLNLTNNAALNGLVFEPLTYRGTVTDTTVNTDKFSKLEQSGRTLKYIPAVHETATKNYVKLTLQFRTTGPGTIQLDAATTMLGGTLNENTWATGNKTWNTDAAFKVLTGDEDVLAMGGELTTNVANAGRIMTISNETTPTKRIFEKPENTTDTHNTVGLNKADDGFGAIDYFKKKTGITSIALESPEEYDVADETKRIGTDETIATVTAGTNTTGTGYLDGTGNYFAQVDLYIWMEGWDKECLNALFNGALKVDLAFEFVPQA